MAEQRDSRQEVYRGDDLTVQRKGHRAQAEKIPFGADIEGVLFDGYPELIKGEETQPTYPVKLEKDVKVPMRDGVHLYTDIYRPDAEGEKFPALLAYAYWQKDVNESYAWMAGHPPGLPGHPLLGWLPRGVRLQLHRSPGVCPCDPGSPRRGQFRGVWHEALVQLRGCVRHGGVDRRAALVQRKGRDDRTVRLFYYADPRGAAKPPHLAALRCDECACGTWDYFNGTVDIMAPYMINTGGHGNDSPPGVPNYEYTRGRAAVHGSAGPQRAAGGGPSVP